METRKAWVFAGGEFHINDMDAECVASTDLIIGVDRGIEYCLLSGLVPDVIMGDFDSVNNAVLSDPRLVDKPIIRHPVRKNNSDLELALQWLANEKIQRVILLGISGGRSDHHLFNWLLPLQQVWPFAIEFVDRSVHAYCVNANHPLNISAQAGQHISLLPIPQAVGVSTVGLEYALQDVTLSAGTTLGLSNVAVAETVGVSIDGGQLLVFHVKIADAVSRGN